MRTISMDGTASIISSASSRFALGGSAEAGALVHGLDDGGDHARVSMAEDERPPGADIIEIAIVVNVEEIRPLAASDEQRLPADAAEGASGAVDAAGDEPASAPEGFVAAGASGWHGRLLEADWGATRSS